MSDLRSVVRGTVLLAGDDGFDDARRPWNLAIEQPVLAVVEAADADDVSALVRYARSIGVAVSAQPSGHGASGNTDGVILLRTRRLDEVVVDAAARTARVGAGVASRAVQTAATAHGLTGMPGSSPVVSVTGYTLGGGLGWFARKYGWAADHVTAFEIVDAEGNQSRVTADADPDLFWALRGGGGDIALVTAIEYGLHHEPDLFGGRMVWPAERAPEVLAAFRAVTADAPQELTLWADLFQFPGSSPIVSVDVTYLGGEADARALLTPLDGVDGLLSDSRAVLPMIELGSITADPTDPGPGSSRAELLTDLDDLTVKALLAEPIAPLLAVQIRHLGGALAQASDSPHGAVREPYLVYLFGLPITQEAAAGITAKQQAVVDSLGGAVSGRKPLTFLNPAESAAAAFAPEALARLRQIKADRDPHGVIRGNFPVNG
ncbi:FAD-binding oxidoreductase [Solihabitans fulvus]|nr:FAD-binding protein [Solihabitans fulvus]